MAITFIGENGIGGERHRQRVLMDALLNQQGGRGGGRGRGAGAGSGRGGSEPSGCWQQEQGGARWTGEEDGARPFEGDEAMENLRAHPQWQR